MIHTYSLIHDDLPCMDNDDLRRGKPTLHKVVSEGMALLTGDYLLTYAFEVIAKAENLGAEEKLKLIQILSSSAGAEGMIGGQAIDIGSVGIQISEETLLKMHEAKTGALIAASLQFGAVIGGASHCLRKLGKEIGLAFQFLDDLLDATSTLRLLGKNVKRDTLLGKPTAVTLFGIVGVRKRLKDLEISIRDQLSTLPSGAPLISEPLQEHLWNRIPRMQ
jgi:geranylgeranyl diphosphate synthase type II